MTVMTIPRRSLLSTLLFFALGVAANPAVVNQSLIQLKLFKQHNFTSAHNLVTHDQARAQELKNRASKGNVAVPVNTQITNQAVTYTASVGVGNPPTTCAHISCCDLWFLMGYTPCLDSLIIDTGRFVLRVTSGISLTVFKSIVPTPGSAPRRANHIGSAQLPDLPQI